MAENASFDILIEKIRPSDLAVGDDKKKRKGKEREGKGREGKVHKVTRRYILAICGADTPRPILIIFGMRVAPRNIINVSNFVIKSSGVSDLQGVKFPVFQLTLLVIVTTVLNNYWEILHGSLSFIDLRGLQSGLHSNNQSSCTSVYTGPRMHTLLTSFVRWHMSKLGSDYVPVHFHH